MVGSTSPTNAGQVRSASGTIGDIEYQNLTANFSIVGKETEINDVKLQAFDGTITGDGGTWPTIAGPCVG